MMFDHLKDDYLKAAKTTEEKRPACYSAEQIFLLRDMAKHDVYPDGRFSDEECNIWSAFRN